MKRLFLASAVAAALAAPTMQIARAADAAPASPHTFTGNVGLFSQYIFRGLTQTNESPALQGGFDYSHSSGFYVGTWASNIGWFTDQNVGSPKGTAPGPTSLGAPGGVGAPFIANLFNSTNVEWDFYGGYKGSFSDNFTFDVGALKYYYPGKYENLANLFSKPDTLEFYGSLGWKWITAKYSQSVTDTFGVKNSKGSNYLDISAAIPIGDSGFKLGLHYGKQTYKGSSPVLAFGWGAATTLTNNVFSYSDYKASLTKDWLGMTWSLAATSTNAKAQTTNNRITGDVYQNVYGRNIGKSQITLGVQKTF
ncbi:MAG: hypothetical protein FJY55_06055 [Betaproteobacteria bacterium]|nr:hypothetical protein [Betaproteobacteria bacterium]